MYKIKIFTIGKTKEAWLDEALKEYYKRLSSLVHFEWVLVKEDKQLQELAHQEDFCIGLDPTGASYTSENFSVYLLNQLQMRGSRLTFIIGGPSGLPKELKTLPLISLSPLTFTHQLTRLVLVEQIYRALEIAKGSSYHK